MAGTNNSEERERRRQKAEAFIGATVNSCIWNTTDLFTTDEHKLIHTRTCWTEVWLWLGRYEECHASSVGYSVGEPKGDVTIQYKTVLCVF